MNIFSPKIFQSPLKAGLEDLRLFFSFSSFGGTLHNGLYPCFQIQLPRVGIPELPQKISEEKMVMLLSLEKSGQWLENVHQTHPALASGELVLQKN